MGNPPSMDNRFFRRAMAPSGSPRLEAEPRPSAGNVTAHQPPTFVGRNRKSRSREAACEGDGYGDLCPSCTANSPWRAKGYFGEFFRRMRAKLGTAQAITATTHKIARTLYHILLTKKPCAETVLHRCDTQAQRRAEIRLRKQAARLGFQLFCPSLQHENNN